MTSNEQIDKLEIRVGKLEETQRTDIAALHTKIDDLKEMLTNNLVSQAEHKCPSPGACLVLSKELEFATKVQTSTLLRVERLDLRLLSVEQWQWKWLGAVTAIVGVITIFGPFFRKLFKLE